MSNAYADQPDPLALTAQQWKARKGGLIGMGVPAADPRVIACTEALDYHRLVRQMNEYGTEADRAPAPGGPFSEAFKADITGAALRDIRERRDSARAAAALDATERQAQRERADREAFLAAAAEVARLSHPDDTDPTDSDQAGPDAPESNTADPSLVAHSGTDGG